jgi:hypothetical protein
MAAAAPGRLVAVDFEALSYISSRLVEAFQAFRLRQRRAGDGAGAAGPAGVAGPAQVGIVTKGPLLLRWNK